MNIRKIKWLLAGAALSLTTGAMADGLNIFVSIAPQKQFVEQIGGDRVDVTAMVQADSNPTTYEPSPRQMAKLGSARLYFRIGVPFERVWMERLTEINPEMAVVDLRQGVSLREMEAHHHHGETADHGHEAPHEDREDHTEHEHEQETDTQAHQIPEETGKDPHIWTDPHRVMQMADTIKEALIRLDSDHASQYEANYQAFLERLSELDRDIHRLLENDRSGQRFMVFHPSWGYFAEAYGLEQVPIEIEGKEPSARQLAQLIERARTEQVNVIFVQPQFSRKAAQRVADAIGARLAVLDPLAEDYFANMRRVAGAIAEAGQ